MLEVPIQAVPSQTLAVVLANQPCRINIYSRRQGLFVDLYVNNLPIVTGVIALDANRLVRDAYLGFIGDLAFYDTLGSDDPAYTGLGSRYVLLYLEASDLVA